MRKMVLVYAWFEAIHGRGFYKTFDDYANDTPTEEIIRPEGWYLIAKLGTGLLEEKIKLLQKNYSRLKLKEIEMPSNLIKESIVASDLKEPVRSIFGHLMGDSNKDIPWI